jgi:hypothetical protein
MITKIIIVGIVVMFMLCLCIFYYEIKHAPTIDPKEPFLWDDYDEKKNR